MVAGEVTPDVFNSEMQKVIFPTNVNQLRGQLGNQGPIKAFDLMRVENTAEGKRRVYRVTFQSNLRVIGSFTLDTQGKISGFGVRAEQ